MQVHNTGSWTLFDVTVVWRHSSVWCRWRPGAGTV